MQNESVLTFNFDPTYDTLNSIAASSGMFLTTSFGHPCITAAGECMDDLLSFKKIFFKAALVTLVSAGTNLWGAAAYICACYVKNCGGYAPDMKRLYYQHLIQ
jgi:hypothetical protein